MKIHNYLFAAAVILTFAVSCNREDRMTLESPGGDIRVSIRLSNEGKVAYSVFLDEVPVIEPSSLGILMEDGDYYAGLVLDSVSEVTLVKDNYTLLYGKTKEADYKANRRVFHLSSGSGGQMDVIFQVSDDGIAFCYSFPDTSETVKKITSEKTGFSFAAGTTAWIQPRAQAKSGWNQCNPSYEEHYLEEVLLDSIRPDNNGWVFPALFRTENCWVNLTESWPERNYCGSHLNKGGGPNEMVIAFPESSEGFTGGAVYPQSALPWTTPWRILTMGSSPGVIVESTHGTDLARPSEPGDFSYVMPGRASWSWALMKDGSVNYEVQKDFISYASEMGWEYCLVDVNWDTTIGWEKLAELSRIAAGKNVALIAWYNSAGDWNTVPYHPKDKLLTHESREAEFSKLQQIGIKGIKVDFFGGDGQSMMDYYQDILADAHRHHLIVNCHGSTLPRGLHRTWPNLVSMEAIRGLEYATFDQESADKVPSKATTVALIRNAFDPMDFTPVCFTAYDNFERVTGNGAELAMAVLFLSGVQHYAETPAGMAMMPDYIKEIMGAIPVAWDETRFIDGYPGKFMVIARRTGDVWYIAGINAGREPLAISMPLPFIDQKDATLVTEGNTPRSFTQKKITIDNGTSSPVTINPEGGFVLRFDPYESIKPEND
jgi:Glycosyl-hydrolase 97 N-terminal/Glycoside hydrolase 97/Glycosyl-hydrolase 97 C-terminal, oligomerisation